MGGGPEIAEVGLVHFAWGALEVAQAVLPPGVRCLSTALQASSKLPFIQPQLLAIRCRMREADGTLLVILPALPWAPNYLNVVLDTATLPHANHRYPSWGTVRLQWIDPLTTLSRYVARAEDLSPETFRAWGCARGQSLPPWGGGVVILDFGYPAVQGEEYGARILNWPNPFISTTAIMTLTRSFLDGFAGCNPSAWLYLALGVNNNQYGVVTREHGQAWAQMVNALNRMVRDHPHWDGRFRIRGAIDAEPGWNSSQVTREWVEGYTEVADLSLGSYLLNFGSCECNDRTGTPVESLARERFGLDRTWAFTDVVYISWTARPAFPFPEIYHIRGSHARQWLNVARFSAEWLQTGRIHFLGVLTQWDACQQIGRPEGETRCPSTDNRPMEGYLQIHQILGSMPEVAVPPLFSSDISWEDLTAHHYRGR